MRSIGSALPRLTRRLRRDESGQDIIEYGLIAGIIALTSLIMFVAVAPKMGVA
jgi:Flp pilus assembly pilin Flp